MTNQNAPKLSTFESSNRIRVRAVAVQLAAHLDGRYVDLTIITDRGQTVAITCDNRAIFEVKRRIEQLAQDCPEVASWDLALPTA